MVEDLTLDGPRDLAAEIAELRVENERLTKALANTKRLLPCESEGVPSQAELHQQE